MFGLIMKRDGVNRFPGTGRGRGQAKRNGAPGAGGAAPGGCPGNSANRPAVLEYTSPSTGTYYVGVDECGTTGSYVFYGSQYRLKLSDD